MQAIAIINFVDAYKIQLSLQPISINTHEDEISPNLDLLFPKSI